MDANVIMQLVGSLGFPIVCCGALFVQQNKTMKDFNDKMEACVDKMAENIAQNTIAINTLVTTVTVLVKKDGDAHG